MISNYLIERGRMLEQEGDLVQDRPIGEPDRQQMNMDRNLAIDRDYSRIETPCHWSLNLPWPDRTEERDRATGPAR
ncbi:MAG: hypothetical protein OXN96_01225 [Bryobacterales bacterium]|nr:hypothetical protein [Bryobacterales bacterium]